MGEPIRRRAVRDGQKETRRLAIVETGWQLFQKQMYEELTMLDVAKALGLVKGTVYLYFRSKEELFLAITEQQLEGWFAEVDAHLAAIEDSATIENVVEVICDALERRPGLTRLLAILHTILEQNIELETARRFKYMLKEHFEQTGALLEDCLPFLSAGAGPHVLLQSHALVIGLWHLSDPSAVIRELLQEPDLRLFEIAFAPEFSQALSALLYGLEQRAKKAKEKQ
jgi:AcrR family transcriptional regulator